MWRFAVSTPWSRYSLRPANAASSKSMEGVMARRRLAAGGMGERGRRRITVSSVGPLSP